MFPQARGQRQSPVDIVTSKTQNSGDLQENPLRWTYVPENTRSLVNPGYCWRVDVNGKGSMLTGGPLQKEQFILEQFHCHWGCSDSRGSEHTVDGESFAGELHLVHWNQSKYKSFAEAAGHPDGLAVLGVFLKVGKPHPELDIIARLLPFITHKGDRVTLNKPLDPARLLPEGKAYWTYLGSLTTPPCSESVTWILFKEPIEVSHEQLELFREMRCYDAAEECPCDGTLNKQFEYGKVINNFRPPLELGNRQLPCRMGKAKKLKLHHNKPNPTGLMEVNELIEQGLAESAKSGTPVEAIVEQLESAVVEEKICGLQSLATICQGEANIGELVRNNVIRIAASLLVDPDQSVRHATAGALRNLSVISVELCEFMVDQDVLTPLLALLVRFPSNGQWTPTFDKNMQNQMDEHSDTFLHAVNLLWNLCESTSDALNAFNQSQLLENFVSFLDYNVYGQEIAIAVAQCLLVVSEDNASSWRVLANHGAELLSLLTIQATDNATLMLRALSAGIIGNVPVLLSSHTSKVLISVSKTLEMNHRSALGNLTSMLPLEQQKDLVDLEVTDDVVFDDETEAQSHQRRRKADLPSEGELTVRDVGRLLQAQRIAAEILTNICSSEDDWQSESNDNDNNAGSDAESVYDYDTNGLNESVENTDKISVEVLEAIKSLALVEKLWQKAQPVAENVYQILVESEQSTLKKLDALRISAMLCLHNLCNNISTDDLGGPTAVYNVWIDLGQQVFQGQRNAKLLEASTSLMRAALEHLRKSPELFQQMTENDLQLMLNGVTGCEDIEIRANWLRMLGILGCLLPESHVKVIIDFVLNTCANEADVWVLAEALDSMMDIFADNDWHSIMHELGMVTKCKQLDRIMREKLKRDKRQLGDRFPAVSTVRTNLGRFCKYLETELKTFKPNMES
uniref:Alpha-carbonic anhydrase domain-containing protein n=1 Tax=Anopheles minimus TaxID=112268 RepID=A0A182W8K4_9DIPT